VAALPPYGTEMTTRPPLSGTRRSWLPDAIFRGGVRLSGATAVLFIVVIAATIGVASGPLWQQFGLGFIGGDTWDEGQAIFGALPFLAGTVITSVLAMVVAVPVSLLVAIYLAEFAPRRLALPITFLIELIAAIPSVVIGLWGLLVVTPLLRDTVETWVTSTFGDAIPFLGGDPLGSDVFAASLVLGLMVAPTIVAISREVIGAVPGSYREAFLGLGATRWETVRKVVLPAARSGIIGAIILGLGRAIGETMAVTMMIGNADHVPTSLFDQGQTIASKIATSFGEATQGIQVDALLALALVLMALTLGVSIVARILIGRSFAAMPADR
jgi:phosphate transport system permease protein